MLSRPRRRTPRVEPCRGDAIVEETTNGTITRSYLVDDAGTILRVCDPTCTSPTASYLPVWNGHGDATALYRINGDGTLTLANSYTYDTWGTPTTATHNGIADLGFRFLYVGAHDVQWDTAYGLGLTYMHARHYHPFAGRFLQPAPARAETNTYAYAAASPVTRLDPTGTRPAGWWRYITFYREKPAVVKVAGLTCSAAARILKIAGWTGWGAWATCNAITAVVNRAPDRHRVEVWIKPGKVWVRYFWQVRLSGSWVFARYEDVYYNQVPGGRTSNAIVCAQSVAGWRPVGSPNPWAETLNCGPRTRGITYLRS